MLKCFEQCPAYRKHSANTCHYYHIFCSATTPYPPPRTFLCLQGDVQTPQSGRQPSAAPVHTCPTACLPLTHPVVKAKWNNSYVHPFPTSCPNCSFLVPWLEFPLHPQSLSSQCPPEDGQGLRSIHAWARLSPLKSLDIHWLQFPSL